MAAELELHHGQVVEPWEQPGPTNLPKAAAALVEWARAASAAHALAESLCKTNFVPAVFRGKPDEATACILAGAEVGLSPMASLQGFDMISGAAYPKALTLRAVLLSMGHEIVIDQSTPLLAKGRARRRDGTEWQHAEWTIQRARQLGLIGKTVPAKDNWIKQPTAMLVARLTSELARLVAADAILGIAYSAEEVRDGLGEQVTPPSSPSRTVSRAAPAAATPVADPEPAAAEDIPATEDVVEQPQQPLQMITTQQQRLLHLLLNKRKMNRDQSLAWLTDLLGRTVESTKDITKAEAGEAIDALERPDPDEPPPDEPPPDDRGR